MPELVLYYSPSCPFCKKVTDFMLKHDIKIKMVDRDWSQENRQELIDKGGKPQVPCLLIDGKALYESDDIVKWFQDNLVAS
ncbi:Glutaredoxin [Desulfamplus magnetovallimortis]|uniref:Glutaredoxin n=1 Tax=Desulfamplus magnetovallimortis TaxID=1246637 RepID=A0A1W1H852_9BACT|nr:glutaredoxin [Desulfamplus magnetovallimortis]SLM28652.1 Glutaredoxin [Desulfamplus magnetovallimortis]